MVGLALVAVHARCDDVTATTDTVTVSLSGQIQSLFDTHCVVCHQYGAEQAGLNLEDGASYDNLVNVASTQSPLMRVVPHKPAESYLMLKLLGTHREAGGEGVRMPLAPPGIRALSDRETEMVRTWIEQGAPDN